MAIAKLKLNRQVIIFIKEKIKILVKDQVAMIIAQSQMNQKVSKVRTISKPLIKPSQRQENKPN